jgi:hypothetical protein
VATTGEKLIGDNLTDFRWRGEIFRIKASRN